MIYAMEFESYLQIIVFIVTILAALTAAIYDTIRKGKLGVVAFLAACFIILVVIGSYFLFISTPASDQNATQNTIAVRITTPANNGTVKMDQSLNGLAQNVPKNQSLWVVIYSPYTRSYYPQEGPISISESGLWSSQAYIGNNNDSGKQFEILAISANKSVDAFLTNYLERGLSTGDYPAIPLEEFPQVNIVDQIIVTRE